MNETEVTTTSWTHAINKEILRAKKKFPQWPTDPLHALAVLQEEVGELTKGVLNMVYEPSEADENNVMEEAIQVGAMVHRFLDSLFEYRYNKSEQHIQR